MIQIPVSVLLKISPLVFAFFLEIFPIHFGQKLRNVVERYSGAGTVDENYINYSVYAYDWFESKYLLILSLIYTSLLFLSTFVESVQAQGPRYWLLGPMLFFFFSSCLMGYLIDRWYNITGNRHPDHYYLHYYTDSSLDQLRDTDTDEFEDEVRGLDDLADTIEGNMELEKLSEVYPPSVLSIRWLTRYVEIGLIGSIIILEVFRGSTTIHAEIVLIAVMILLSVFSFFWEELYNFAVWVSNRR